MTEQEMNKKLAEWAGLKEVVIHNVPELYPEFDCMTFLDTEGRICFQKVFTKSIDACFKWLVPNVHAYVLQSFHTGHGYHRASVVLPYTSRQDMKTFKFDVSRSQNPALALCIAILLMIESEEKAEKGRRQYD